MALTKVSGGILDPGINVAGIVTAIGFDGPFVGGIGDHIIAGIVTATALDINGNADISGSLTVGSGGLDLNGSGDISGDLVIHGNLTANGDFTTLNTTLREVELLKVDADSSTTAGIITQRGSGNILDIYDTSSAVFSVRDGGNIIMGASAGSITPHAPLHIRTATTGAITTLLKLHGPFTSNTGSEGTSIDFGTASDTSTGARIIGTREAAGAKGALRFCTGRENDSGFNDGRMIIDETGNIGIGSVTPNEKLDVVGVSSFTGDVFFKGGITSPTPRDMFWDYSASELRFNDNAIIYLGSNKDAFLSHDGSATRLQDNYGHFFIGGNLIQMKSGNLGEEYIRMDNTSKEVKLYHNSSQRLNTTAQGINVTTVGDTPQVAIAQTTTTAYSVNGTVSFVNANNTTSQIQGRTGAASTTGDILFLCNTVGDESLAILEDGKVRVPDRGRFVVGNGNDLSLYHDNGGSGSHIENSGSNLTVRTTGSYLYMHGNNIHLRSQTGNETMLTAVVNNAVSLYYDASTYTTPKLQTTSTGTQIDTILKLYGAAGNPGKLQLQEGGAVSEIRVERSTDTSSSLLFGTEISGTTATRWKIDTGGNFLPTSTYNIGSTSAEIGNVYVADSKTIYVGSDQDFRIGHDPTHTVSYIQNTGSLNIQTDDLRLYNYSTADLYLRATTNSSVQLFYDYSTYTTPKLETSATGITVDGKVVASGEIETAQDYPTIQPTLNFNFAATKKLDPRISYSRTGAASYYDEFGLLKIVGDNVPRFDHDPDTGECKGLLIEEQRTNLLSNSDIAAMSSPNLGGNPQVNTTVDNITLPTGEQGTVRSYLANASGGGGRWGDYSGTNNTKYTGSVWVRTVSGTGSAQIDINDGGVKTISLTEEWQRVTTTASTNNTYRFFDIYFATPVSIYYWGVQIETGQFVTSYIPTYESSKTRGADLVEITEEEFSEFYNRTEGSFVSEITLPPSFPVSGYGTYMMTLSDGSYNNRVTLASSTSSAQFNADVNIGSSTPSRANLGSYTSGSHSIKAAMAYKTADTAGSLNGAAAVTTSPSGTLPLLTRADIGKDHANYNLLNGHMKRLMYYSKRLPNNQLRTLTS